MKYDNLTPSDGKKHCSVCNLEYEGECPSCNPRHTYYVEAGVPSGPDDFTFIPCQCNECPNNGYWRKEDAIAHAKASITFEDSLVRVCDDQGTEVWSNR